MIPDTNFDPIFEGLAVQWGIPATITGTVGDGGTISGEVISATKEPQSEKFVGKDSQGNINRKVWHGRHLQYTIECVVAQTLAESALPGEGDQVTIDSYVCLCDAGAKIQWAQDGETKVSMTLHYYPHMVLSTGGGA